MSDITIDLITPKDVLLEKTSIPQEYTVQQIIQELVEHLNLPYFVDGSTVDYSLRSVSRNTTLNKHQTLADAGIGAGDQLKLTSSVDLPKDLPSDPLPAGPASSDGMIEVVLSVLDLNKNEKETLDLDLPVQGLLQMIAKTNRLPEGETYYMKSKALGRVLGGSETLRSAKVPKLDRLSVLRQEIAG